MGKRIIISESEKKNILSLYETMNGLPYESKFIENKNPFKDSKYSEILNNKIFIIDGGIKKDLQNPEVGMKFFVVKIDELINEKDRLTNELMKNFDGKTVSISNEEINPNNNLFKINYRPTKSENFNGVTLMFMLTEITKEPNISPITILYTFILNEDYKTKKYSTSEGSGFGYTILKDSNGNSSNQIVRSNLNTNLTNKVIETFNSNGDMLHPYMGSWDEADNKFFDIKEVTKVTNSDF